MLAVVIVVAPFVDARYHDDLQTIVAKSRSQQQQLLSTFEAQHERQTDEMLSDAALQQSERLNEVRACVGGWVCACGARVRVGHTILCEWSVRTG